MKTNPMILIARKLEKLSEVHHAYGEGSICRYRLLPNRSYWFPDLGNHSTASNPVVPFNA